MDSSKSANKDRTSVVLVEDNLAQADLMRHLLVKQQYIVQVIRDGKVALDFLLQNDDIDIVLLDNIFHQ